MATLTLKNVPQDLYDRLKARAAANRRSMNQEAISSLEEVLLADATNRILEETRKHRDQMAAEGIWVTQEEVEAWIKEGRR